MRNNYFEKEIKEKLAEIKPAYSPADWSAMEALLDDQQEKPVVFPLFNLMAIAASVVAAMGAISLYQINVEPTQPLLGNRVQVGGSSNMAQENLEKDEIVSPFEENQESNDAINNLMAEEESIKNQPINENGSSHHPIESPEKIEKNNINIIQPQNKPAANSIVNAIETNEGKLSEFEEMTSLSPYASRELKSNSPEPAIATPLIASAPISIGGDRTMVEHGLVLESGVKSSTLKGFSFTSPGTYVGASYELMFRNKVGIYAGLRYGKTAYVNNDVKCSGNYFYDCPESYRSTHRTIQMPIGTKFNIVGNSNMNLYAKVGFSALVNIEEQFEYELPTSLSLAPPETTSYREDVLAAAEANFDQDFPKGPTTEFTISGSDRLFGEYNAAIGAEIKVSPKLKLLLEPNFALTMDKVGVQDSRLASFGSTIGLKYRFI